MRGSYVVEQRLPHVVVVHQVDERDQRGGDVLHGVGVEVFRQVDQLQLHGQRLDELFEPERVHEAFLVVLEQQVEGLHDQSGSAGGTRGEL